MTQRLSDVVAWHVAPTPRVRRGLRWVPLALGLLVVMALNAFSGLEFGAGSGREGGSFDPKVRRPGKRLGGLSFQAAGGLFPARFPYEGVADVYVSRVTVCPRFEDVDLPLTQLRLVRARPAHSDVPQAARKRVATEWVMQVEGAGMKITFTGPWLFLAHVGTLASWSEPV